jgi:pyruvate/2-oxoglutarate dehydrogenase complex dihydrolipoamide dehydrogenase (E3) component
MREYDVLVLGGGTGGTAAAKAAHDAGARVAMFNEGELGGLCILRGCMPTKTMLHAAHLRHHARHHRTLGVDATDPPFDFESIMRNKDAKVARFQRAKIASIAGGGYEVIDARARFVAPDQVEAGGERYRFTRGAVIATGSVTDLPELEGLDEVEFLTSDEVMTMREPPRSLLVVGVGAIGVELAQFFARLDVEVDLVGRRPIFADADPLISAEAHAAMRDEPNLQLHLVTRLLAVREVDGGVALEVEADGAVRTLSAERILLATGRRPNIDGLGLEAAGVEVAADGRIRCGPDMRTSQPRIFVAGDASGHRLLLHVANWEGRVAGLGAAGAPGPHAVEQRLHVEVVFYDPPMATVGMNEAAARAAGHEVVCASARFAETGRAITMDVQHGAWKLVADRRSGEILGAQLFGPRADDLAHLVSTLMYFRGTAAQVLAMPWYHPTLSEVLLGLAREIEAARRPSA